MNEQRQLIPMQVGEYLEQHRLEQGLTLEKVATEVKLDVKLLADLEADRTLKVARIYRDGYIRTYARYLAVPESEIERLLASSAEEEPGVRNIFSSPTRRNPADKWLRATSYILASLLIGTLAWQFTNEAVRLSQRHSALQDATPGDAPEEQAARLPQAENTVQASIAPLGALHDNPGDTDPAEQAWQALTQPLLAEGESALQIILSADSWVEITDATGRELEMDLLRGGSDKNYHGTPPFRILVGRASAVRLAIDGETVDLSALSREDVAHFSWPQDLN